MQVRNSAPRCTASAFKSRSASLDGRHRKTNRSSLAPSSSRIQERGNGAVATFVANSEGMLSVSDSTQDEPNPRQPGVALESPESDLGVSKKPVIGDQLESMISRSWLATVVLGVTFVLLLLSYNFIQGLTESQMVFMSLLPFVWAWGCRFADLRKSHKVRRILSMAVRLCVFVLILTAGPYQLRTFIFQHQRGIFPACGFFTLITTAGHLLLRAKTNPEPVELRKPDLEFLAPFITDDVKIFKRIEQRTSMAWMYLSGIVVLPFLQEIFYRGICVISLAHIYNPFLASALGALAYNLSQPFESFKQHLGYFFSGFLWGLIFLLANGNLMYPVVAHLMHNAILFAFYHYDNLIECI